MLIGKTLVLTATVAAGFLAAPPAASAISPHSPRARAIELGAVVRRLRDDGAPGALAVLRTPRAVIRAAAGAAVLQPRAPLAATDRFGHFGKRLTKSMPCNSRTSSTSVAFGRRRFRLNRRIAINHGAGARV